MAAIKNFESAFVLHRHDWSETSLILEAFVRGRGRVAVVAKGAKRPTSQLRAVLLPLQNIEVVFTRQKHAGTLLNLRTAQWSGGYVMPTGKRLLGGYELNELLLRLLAVEDPHPTLFDFYSCAVEALARQSANIQAILAAFELHLLKELGWLPNLTLETATQLPLKDDAHYTLNAETGLRALHAYEAAAALTGRQWLQLQHALDASVFLSWQLTCQLCEVVGAKLRPQLKALLLHYSNFKTLRTADLVEELLHYDVAVKPDILLRA